MNALILHDLIPPDAPLDSADALVQARLFEEHLREQGHSATTLGVGLNLTPALGALHHADLVVNLVESLGGRGHLIHLVPTLVESMGLPITGCSAQSIAETSNKLAAKAVMRESGLPTPEWCTAGSHAPEEGRWIVKSVWEHASIGLGPDSILDAAERGLHRAIAEAAPRLGGLAFAERFIEGREFNLSIIETDLGPTVLPPAEIQFVGFGPGKPRIVDYAAKWREDSYEYHHTPRLFEFKPADAGLLTRLRSLALRCWDEFALSGYARVDFRVDELGRPWILEINTNPCLSPDAGFMAAVERAGLTTPDALDAILAAATRQSGQPEPHDPDQLRIQFG